MQRKPATSTLRQIAHKACSFLLLSLLAVAVIGLPLLAVIPAQAVTDQQTVACPTNAVGLRPGDNLQSVVNSRPAGTAFCLAAGTYQNQTIQPRTGDIYIGQSGAIMDGGTTTRYAFKSIFEPNSRNPIKNVTVRGLTIQRYASQTSIKSFTSPEGALQGGEGWLIENNVIKDNISGISIGNANWGWGDGAIIRNNQILNNAEIGVEINGSNILFEGNELAGNGWRLNDQDRTWSGGGSKFTDQPVWADNQFRTTVTRPRTANDHLVLRNNRVHDNVGMGLWLDVYNQFAIVEGNVVENNYGSGIMDELNSGTIIRNNTVRNNRKNNNIGGLWGGGEILIANSQKGDVTGNDITVAGTGRAVVMIYESYRSQWPSRDYYVHHNTIRFQNAPQYRSDGDPIAGILGGVGNDPFWTSNNRYDFNTYYISDPNQKFWYWGQGYNWAGFKSRGHEGNGLCYYGAGNTPCTTGQPAVTATPTRPPATATRPPATVTAQPTSTPTTIPPTKAPPTATLGPTATTSSGAGTPYRGQPLAIPGRIETEDFNIGSNGGAYKDNSPGHADNKPVYRTDTTDVDLKPSPYGGFTLGWFEAGEWLNYAVNVTQPGYYDIILFGGTIDNSRSLHLEMNGQNISGAVGVPVTAAWTTYTQFGAPRIYLDAGPKTLRLTNDTGFLDVDWIEFRSVAATATAVPPTMTRTSTAIPPTAVPPTAVPPTATRVPPTATATTIPPTAVPPTGVPPTATRVPPTATATTIPPTAVPPTGVPPTATRVPPTATATTIPPTAVPPTGVPPTATAVPPTAVPPTGVPPTGVPPTATSIPPQQGVVVRAVLSSASLQQGLLQPGGKATIDVFLDNPQLVPGGGIRALEARCGVAPATVLLGQSVTSGALFGPDPVMVSAGFQTDNTWVYAVSQSGANPPVSVGGVLFSLGLNAVAEGNAVVSCTVSIIDGNKATTALPFLAAPVQVMRPVPTSAPLATATATATALPSATPPATLAATATAIPKGSVNGKLARSAANGDSIAVTVLGTDGAVVAGAATSADGSFTIADIPAGTYTIRAEAPGYLPAEGPLTIVGGQATQKAPLTLVAGYLVSKTVPTIDELDVVQLASSYGQSIPPAAISNDLNADGSVNLPDLGALADNLRTTGPTSWQ